jgi:rhodanese-related sulfurtransferase
VPIRRVSPQEAKELIDRDGYSYVDVRSIPEFEAGHPEGAWNVPLLHMGPAGMAPNAEFLAVMEKAFPKDAKLVVGCKMGGRSLKASELLTASGFTGIVDQRAGFEGAPGDPGWRPLGLPVSAQAAAEQTYEGIRARS